MDLAYDHIQEEALAKPADKKPAPAETTPQDSSSLNTEIQDAYKAFSASPWGARIGGFFGNVVKQGESVYKEASQELTAVGSEASRGLAGWRDTLATHTRNISLNDSVEGSVAQQSAESQTGGSKDSEAAASTDKGTAADETALSRLRSEAAKRLKDIQRAEDAADEALIKFGSNVRDFLRDAVSIAPPAGSEGSADGSQGGSGSTVLFESKDAQGKRVIHTSRFDAQLHVIHTTFDSFLQDPSGSEYPAFSKDLDVEKRTEDISKDLAKYPDLRTTMEKLVPDRVPYADFWKRYYFLRHGIETAEARRKDLLKASSNEEDVKWDSDSEDDSDDSDSESGKSDKSARPASAGSSTTLHPRKTGGTTDAKNPEPATQATQATQPAQKSQQPQRKPNDEEKSQAADSDTSYDVVGAASGNPSQAPNSPKETPRKKADNDDSSDEDWE